MKTLLRSVRGAKRRRKLRLLLALVSVGHVAAQESQDAPPRSSLSGESAAQALKQSLEREPYDIRWGPLRLRTGGSVAVNYTDNVFYSHHAEDDIMVNPGVTLDGLWPVTQMNSLRFSLGLSYEWYLRHHILNANAPLVNPGSEVAFNLFVGDVRLQLHDRFSFEQDIFFNSLFGDNPAFYNFHDVGVFSRWLNQVGVDATWDLNKVVLTASYNHETFDATTDPFKYLNRESELFTARASYALGDGLKAGLEDQTALHNYHQETVLNDNWRTRVGPFVDLTLPAGFHLESGGGLEIARYGTTALPNNDYTSYYGYARLRQDTRLFSQSLGVGRELLLGDLANNMRTTYVRYGVSTHAIAHVDLGANLSFNQGREFGGGYDESFTYYGAGVHAEWQLHKHWRAELGYEFRRKESSMPLLAFYRNRVTLTARYTF